MDEQAHGTFTYGSTFSGIGRLDIAVEAVFPHARCLWQCERSVYRREVLAQTWPHTKQFERVESVSSTSAERVDAIIGGFPCKGASDAGKRTGLDHPQTGLWRELARIIGELRPHFVVLENVRGLLRRGFGEVLGDLATLGFDAEWCCVRAAICGAPQKRRERIFILAWRDRGELGRLVADTVHYRRHTVRAPHDDGDHASGHQPHGRHADQLRDHVFPPRPQDADGWASWTGARPALRRVPHGLPGWVHGARVAEGLRQARLGALGDAVLSQQAAIVIDGILQRATVR